MVYPGQNRLLVVDDEPVICDVLERLLTKGGHIVVTANDGDEALVRASEQPFELALLDIKMPGLSGVDVHRQLASDYPDLCVVMVTAVAEVATAVQAMKQGAYDYMLKPLNLDDVLMRVVKGLENRQLTISAREHLQDLEARLAEQKEELRILTSQIVQNLIKEEASQLEGQEQDGNVRTPSSTTIRRLGDRLLRRLSGDPGNHESG